MAEMDDLAKTLEYLENHIKDSTDTLVVLTADHSTGGFSIGANGDYLWQPDVLRNMKNSTRSAAKYLTNNDINEFNEQQLLPFTLSIEELETLQQIKLDVQEKVKAFEQLSVEEQKLKRKPQETRLLYKKFAPK